MSFFDAADDTDGEVEIGGIKPIPKGTQLLALIEGAAWNSYEGVNTIQLTWSVLAPDTYKGRKVFQKIRVEETNPKKLKNQMTMLKAISINAGGDLLKVEGKPQDIDLARCLVGKQMLIKVEVWEMNGNTGNWICALGQKAALEDPTPTEDEGAPW